MSLSPQICSLSLVITLSKYKGRVRQESAIPAGDWTAHVQGPTEQYPTMSALAEIGRDCRNGFCYALCWQHASWPTVAHFQGEAGEASSKWATYLVVESETVLVSCLYKLQTSVSIK